MTRYFVIKCLNNDEIFLIISPLGNCTRKHQLFGVLQFEQRLYDTYFRRFKDPERRQDEFKVAQSYIQSCKEKRVVSKRNSKPIGQRRNNY